LLWQPISKLEIHQSEIISNALAKAVEVILMPAQGESGLAAAALGRAKSRPESGFLTL
jgi:hypothetical protein